MNAIQYFDWGGENKNIFYCKVMFKNFFTLPEGRNFIGHIPMPIFRSGILYELSATSDTFPVIYSKKTEMYQEGNDFVWNVYIKSPIKENRDLRNLQLATWSPAYERWHFCNSFIKNGSYYVSGRKIKAETVRHGFYFDEKVMYTIITEMGRSVRFEDNNEALTLSSLLNKEIVFEFS